MPFSMANCQFTRCHYTMANCQFSIAHRSRASFSLSLRQRRRSTLCAWLWSTTWRRERRPDPASHRGWKMTFYSNLAIFRVYVSLANTKWTIFSAQIAIPEFLMFQGKDLEELSVFGKDYGFLKMFLKPIHRITYIYFSLLSSKLTQWYGNTPNMWIMFMGFLWYSLEGRRMWTPQKILSVSITKRGTPG